MSTYALSLASWTFRKRKAERLFSNFRISKTQFLFLALVSVISLFYSEAVYSADRIRDIKVEGNSQSLTLAVIRASELEENSEVTDALLQHAQASLLSTGLFDSAEVKQVPIDAPGRVDILIVVKEKTSWFLVPTFSYSKGSMSGGLAVAETNLWGRFKKFGVFGEWGNQSKRIGAGYRDPSLFGTQFILGLDGLLRLEEMDEYQDRVSVRKSKFLEFGGTFLPGVQWSDNFSTSIGLFYRKVNFRWISEKEGLRPVNTRDGHDPAILVEFNYKRMKNIEGVLTGARISLESQLSDNRFFSDYDYFRQILRFTLGKSFLDSQINWVGQGSIQYASNQSGASLPYLRELMAGGLNLRGYLNQQFRGDTRYSLNQDLVFRLFSWKRLIARFLVFHDSSVIYFKDENFSRDAWRNGLGGGIRFYLRGINIPLIGYDIGWGIEDETYAHYVNIGSTF